MIDADQRSQYQLVYRPSDMKPDGSFHTIKLRCLVRGSAVQVRSGYYAPGVLKQSRSAARAYLALLLWLRTVPNPPPRSSPNHSSPISCIRRRRC
jgi:hypothetical protein